MDKGGGGGEFRPVLSGVAVGLWAVSAWWINEQNHSDRSFVLCALGQVGLVIQSTENASVIFSVGSQSVTDCGRVCAYICRTDR